MTELKHKRYLEKMDICYFVVKIKAVKLRLDLLPDAL